ncbi:hypothetical protein [Acholeplasma hippikon]|nr:hypothetical protein [Acholeplasma hippikon]
MKKILLVLSFIFLMLLTGCELTHIQAQFKQNSLWVDENQTIEIIFTGPRKDIGSGYITIDDVKVDALFKTSSNNDKIFIYTKETVENEPYIVYDVKVYIENKVFVKDKLVLTQSIAHEDGTIETIYENIIYRTEIKDQEVKRENLVGISYYNSEFGIRISFDEVSFFEGYYKVLINDRPKNISATFEFKAQQIFEIKVDETLILTGIYKFENNNLVLQFGTNELYQDTNVINLGWYS